MSKVDEAIADMVHDVLSGAPDFTRLQTEVQNIKSDVIMTQAGSQTNLATLQQIQDAMGDMTKTITAPEGNACISAEGDSIYIRDAQGELVLKVGDKVEIGTKYENAPLQGARALLEAVAHAKVFFARS